MHEKRIHQLFVVSLAVKGVHALAEIAIGLALALFSTGVVLTILERVDPHHAIARAFTPAEHNYYTFYFLSHGAVNLALVVGLLREKLWAYPATFAVLTLFIAYQLYRFTHVHDPGLIVLSLLDLIVIGLAWNEYRILRRRAA
jgi:uncharacterized membrane protein